MKLRARGNKILAQMDWLLVNQWLAHYQQRPLSLENSAFDWQKTVEGLYLAGFFNRYRLRAEADAVQAAALVLCAFFEEDAAVSLGADSIRVGDVSISGHQEKRSRFSKKLSAFFIDYQPAVARIGRYLVGASL